MNKKWEALPETLTKHLSTMKVISEDSTNHEFMVDSDLEVINFDGVKDDYNGKLKSNDGLYFTYNRRFHCNWFFIEFKNGKEIEKIKNELFEKIYDSINILSDFAFQNDMKRIKENPIAYFRENCGYILVYNGEKNKIKISNHLARKAKVNPCHFGMNFFQGYLFRNVSTCTKQQFEEMYLHEWEKQEAPALIT